MPINYEQLMALKNLGQKYAYGDREVMLYAYGIGMGADPMDEKELAFVNETAADPRPLKMLRPIRNMLPNLGGVDISPVILFLIIILIERILEYYVRPYVP